MSTELVPLVDLAERINEEHDLAKEALNTGLQHALEAGRLLIEAKAVRALQHPVRAKQLAGFVASPLPAPLKSPPAATHAGSPAPMENV